MTMKKIVDAFVVELCDTREDDKHVEEKITNCQPAVESKIVVRSESAHYNMMIHTRPQKRVENPEAKLGRSCADYSIFGCWRVHGIRSHLASR